MTTATTKLTIKATNLLPYNGYGFVLQDNDSYKLHVYELHGACRVWDRNDVSAEYDKSVFYSLTEYGDLQLFVKHQGKMTEIRPLQVKCTYEPTYVKWCFWP